ncbi:bifunctional diaminohydroxyphosphoribosylaminopyrimidine deaminase/5-amino-6-(5-phosphoribosylamino)uracil reductase RibD [uncultured Planktosalinus sp.]|uniref:bifunctional diaminohydroxyphosphoribosylaminopyrimidine deaminase/5-amino-6-(5-phosphoribosylamino)uracil reductase RibD n=1 Tax=uncultured Planktosalinus sp. TaxID=1810935 RepID=UPI0030D8CB4E
MSKHQIYIQRCIDLAQNAKGKTYPNPMVGSVVVYKNKIIGEGWHQKSGEAHAEVNAIQSVKDKSLLKKSTIYVSLEPCSHYGKTPPCADLIISHSIPKIVIGCLDPNPKVAGRGVKKLIEAGRKVIVGVLEEKCKNVNKRFFTFQQQKRPYIILKWAQTKDGFIAPNNQQSGKPLWITSSASKQLVHKWRNEEQAILVGTNTVLKDNPQLTNRLWEGSSPVRVVLDQHLKIDPKAAVYDDSAKTLILTSKKNTSQIANQNIVYELVDFKKNLPKQICELLFCHNLQSVIVEGGAQTLNTFIKENLWDEARVFIGNITIDSGVKAPTFEYISKASQLIKQDILSYYYND